MAIKTLITPFQFTSRELMAKSLLGNKVSSNNRATSVALESLHSLISWHEMWVNPQSVALTTQQINSKVKHTAGGIVTHHYRRDITVMKCSGVVGWIMIKSELEKMRDGVIESLTDPNNFGQGIGDTISGGFAEIGENLTGFIAGKRNTTNNSPRLFLERLRNLALAPMYYTDKDGIEHYNTKMIKIFTKQYPDGLICEGYFNYFNVPESSSDAQTVAYDFEFIVENEKPVSTLQRLLGMFSGTGNVAGSALGLLS